MTAEVGKEFDSFGRVIPKRSGGESPDSGDDRRAKKRKTGGGGGGAPRLDGPMLSLKEFASESSASGDAAAVASAYDTYISEYARVNGKRFFGQHRDEDWFQERYEPTRVANRLQALSGQAAVQRYAAFQRDFKLNKRIQHLELDVVDAKSDGKSAVKDEFFDHCIVLGHVDKQVSRAQLIELFNKVSGFKKLLLNPADPGKGFSRNGYLFFESNDTARDAMKKFDDYKIAPRVYLRLKACSDAQARASTPFAPFFTAKDPARIEKDLALAIKALRRLNAIIEYLRVVHFYDYYGATEYEDEDEMVDKVGLVHLRESAGAETEPADAAWSIEHDRIVTSRVTTVTKPAFASTSQSNFEKAMAAATNAAASAAATAAAAAASGKTDDKTPAASVNVPMPLPGINGTGSVILGDDVYLAGERNATLEKSLEVFWTEKITSNKEKTKYKCAECAKAFKGPSFVKKHLLSKHIDLIAKVVKKVTDELFLTAYEADAERLTKSMADARAAKEAASGGSGAGAAGRRRSPSRSSSRSVSRSRSRSRSPRRRGGAAGGQTDFQRDQAAAAAAAAAAAFGGGRGSGFGRGAAVGLPSVYQGGVILPKDGSAPIFPVQYPPTADAAFRGPAYGAPPPYGRGRPPYGGGGGFGRPQYAVPTGLPHPMQMPIPAGARADPRALKSYSDLDAPPEGEVEIDYGFGPSGDSQ